MTFPAVLCNFILRCGILEITSIFLKYLYSSFWDMKNSRKAVMLHVMGKNDKKDDDDDDE